MLMIVPPVASELLSKINEPRVLGGVQRNGPASRAVMARGSGMSAPTVSSDHPQKQIPSSPARILPPCRVGREGKGRFSENLPIAGADGDDFRKKISGMNRHTIVHRATIGCLA